ncbi:hypothetical protein BH11CYA1_BH11CYA1_29090 [soil metagenome]
MGTINKVQTTDFNLLHHTLPATLSAMIQEGRDDLIQKTLDSSYGLFGLVVTDPSGENVLYRTNKIYHRQSWQKNATAEGLAKSNEPYDLITDPPQLEPLFAHDSPRVEKARATGAKVRGKILGRIYYMRSPPPPFAEDIGNFLLTGVAEMSGAKRGYFYVSMISIAFALVVLLLVYLRRRGLELKQKEVEHVRRELEIRKKALEHLSNELATQKARKVWLEREADQAYRRAIGLKQNLERLRDALAGTMGNNSSANSANPNNSAVNMQPGTLPGNMNGLQSNFNVGAPPPAGQSNSAGQQVVSHVRIRPPVSPPSSILEEIEILIPDLSDNAKALRSQADILHDYCNSLEERQVEMKRIVEGAFNRPQRTMPAQAPGTADVIDMSPR